MDPAAFIARTKACPRCIIRLTDSLPRDNFIARLAMVDEESDRTNRRLGLLVDRGRIKLSKVALLKQEGVEILPMIIASIRTAKSRC